MRLRLDGVSVDLGGARIVDEIDLDCLPGTVVGVLGPNGSGKSTALRTVYRALAPTAGAVLVDDRDAFADLSPREHAVHVAALTQEHGSGFDVTVIEVVATGRSPHQSLMARESAQDRRIVTEALGTVGMSALAGRSFDGLSGGEKQRVLLARALVQQPRVLVLDEPTNHLDIATQIALLALVRGLGITVLTALHDLNLAAMFCDVVYVMREGRIVASGPPDDVFSQELAADVFGVRADLHRHAGTGALQLTFSALDA